MLTVIMLSTANGYICTQ